MTRSKKRRYSKKQRARDEKNWQKQRGNDRGAPIRETIRVYNTGYRPPPKHPWRYAKEQTGACAICNAQILIGDMLMPAAKGQRKRHYHCVDAASGGGKHGTN